MARTPEGRLLTRHHRQLQVRVRAGVLADLTRLWKAGVTPADLDSVARFAAVAPTLVRAGHGASSAGASRYYQAFRVVEGVPGSVSITLATPPDHALVTGLLRGAALSGFANGRRRGMTSEAALRNGFVKVAGSASSLVLDGGRATLLDAVQGDRHAAGWQRVTNGGCDFCEMLAGRGAVYKGEDTADFQTHDHCTCSAEPVWE